MIGSGRCGWSGGGGGGEWMRELGLGFPNPAGTGGVLGMCLYFGCGGLGGVCGEWAWTRVVVLCLCESGLSV